MRTAEFDRTFEEIYAFNAHLAERSGLLRNQIRSWLALYAACLVVILGYALWRTGEISVIYAPVAVGLGLAVVFPPFYRWVYRWATKRNLRRFVGGGRECTHHCLAISDAGLRDSGSQGDSVTPWKAIREVTRSEDRLFIFTGPAEAHIVPRRAFGSAAEMEAFAKEVEGRRDAERTART